MPNFTGSHRHKHRHERFSTYLKAQNGRAAGTMEELEQWVGSPEGRAALASNRDRRGKSKQVVFQILDGILAGADADELFGIIDDLNLNSDGGIKDGLQEAIDVLLAKIDDKTNSDYILKLGYQDGVDKLTEVLRLLNIGRTKQ
jgi:hypothetical protein